MSYCRWSSDNFRCDLYVYNSIDDTYVIHVAAKRRIGDWGESPYEAILRDPDKDIPKDWSNQVKAYHERLNAAPLMEIKLPYAGSTLYEKSPEGLLRRLLELRKLGYCFPDEVLDTVREEIENANQA